MRFVKRCRYPLIAIFVVGIGGMAVAYFRSPGYRAAQAYARIQEGMTRDEARKILAEWGGERFAANYQGPGRGLRLPAWEDIYEFGARCAVTLEFEPNHDDWLGSRVSEKRLFRPTIIDWLCDSVNLFKPTVDEGAGFSVGTGVPAKQLESQTTPIDN
jgi:hypothetical protein